MICPNCNREFFEGGEKCPHCGIEIDKGFFETSTNLEDGVVKNKKSPKKIIIAVIAVVLAIAIALGVFYFLNQKNNPGSQEKTLKEILAENTDKTVVEFIHEDFDSDGSYEAYAITSIFEKKDNFYIDADIWFINEDGAHKLKNSVFCYLNGLIDINEKIFVSFEIKTSENAESLSYIYSAKNNKPI